MKQSKFDERNLLAEILVSELSNQKLF